jgi:tRNA pseudouridine13 synthase
MPEARTLSAALAPPRALGGAVGSTLLRQSPEDFEVAEELGFPPDGDGSHRLLRVRKRNANTQWVARELARAAGCRERDVGFAGLKDRRAVATQWFSVPGRGEDRERWHGHEGRDFVVLEAHAHRRKLPRGALAWNRFTIRLREFSGDREALRGRLEALRTRGAPNYFGAQRFGKDGANLDRIGRIGGLRRHERGFVLSAARSLIFNAVLAERVTAGDWERLVTGDVAMLDGRGSVFPIEAVDVALEARCERLEVHPTGALWGAGESMAQGRVAAMEARVAAHFPEAVVAVNSAGMRHERRSLRVVVRDLAYDLAGDPAISFRLSRGAFATSVLRELVDCTHADIAGEDLD